jgi:hypothetical protein
MDDLSGVGLAAVGKCRCPLSRLVAQTQTSTIVCCVIARANITKLAISHARAPQLPVTFSQRTSTPPPSSTDPHPTMALPKRIIKETERLMNEP